MFYVIVQFVDHYLIVETMSQEKLIITIFAKDRPGIVQQLSDSVLAHKGNWLESSLSRLCGQFVGIVHIDIDQQARAALLKSLVDLDKQGIHVTEQSSDGYEAEGDDIEAVDLVVEANDRPGIVEEITSALAAVSVNVEQMETECESASMAGYQLFRAHLMVALPEGLGVGELEKVLEGVSDDLMVSIAADD